MRLLAKTYFGLSGGHEISKTDQVRNREPNYLLKYRLYLFLPPKRKRPTDREFVLEDSIEIRYASIPPGRENRVTS